MLVSVRILFESEELVTVPSPFPFPVFDAKQQPGAISPASPAMR